MRRCLQVADFGESKQFDTKEAGDNNTLNLSHTQVGTYLYMAPEVLEGKRYNKSVDVFAYALMLLEIVLSNARWTLKSGFTKLAYVQGWRPTIPGDVHQEWPELEELINEAWQRDPSKRPSFVDIERRILELKPDEDEVQEARANRVAAQAAAGES